MNEDDLQRLTDDELGALSYLVQREQRRRMRFLRVSMRKVAKAKSKAEPGDRVRYWSIYVLMLKHNKRYVGITAQKVEDRYQQHAAGIGAKWTKLHPPIGILESYGIGIMSESDAQKMETTKTLDVIAQYGSENVRGGSLVRVDQKKLDRTYERLLRKHLRGKEP